MVHGFLSLVSEFATYGSIHNDPFQNYILFLVLSTVCELVSLYFMLTTNPLYHINRVLWCPLSERHNTALSISDSLWWIQCLIMSVIPCPWLHALNLRILWRYINSRLTDLLFFISLSVICMNGDTSAGVITLYFWIHFGQRLFILNSPYIKLFSDDLDRVCLRGRRDVGSEGSVDPTHIPWPLVCLAWTCDLCKILTFLFSFVCSKWFGSLQ